MCVNPNNCVALKARPMPVPYSRVKSTSTQRAVLRWNNDRKTLYQALMPTIVEENFDLLPPSSTYSDLNMSESADLGGRKANKNSTLYENWFHIIGGLIRWFESPGGSIN
eukprot:Platyproteum_vivax@DN3487_c0_g1_i2.p1